MALRSRRTVLYLALVVVTTSVFTIVYNTGMAHWEGRPQPLYRSFEVVVQSFTTTGYGEDAPWQTPQMHVLVVAMQIAGIGLILTAVDVYAVPWLRSTLRSAAPTMIEETEDHIVICSYTPRTNALIEELDSRQREYVLLEPDPEMARELHESGYRVIHGDPEETEALENAHLVSARALVADVADDTNASITLTARAVSPDVEVITLIEDADLTRYHRAAGVDSCLSPRQLLGESLAGEVPTAVTTDIEEGIALGEDIEVVELTVRPDSDLTGNSVTEVNFRERFDVDVLGFWEDGDFETPVDPDRIIESGMRLLIVGESDGLAALAEAMRSTVETVSPQRIVLAGFGDSGQAAYGALADTRSRLTVLDVESTAEVNVTGDASDPAVLRDANVEEASTLLLTIGDDTTAIFTTLIARELNPDLRIVVRANEEENVEKLYRAGADYVQSLARVSGRMLASTIFEDEEVMTYDKQVSIVRRPAPGLAGRTVADANVRDTTGCTVVAIRRDGDLVADFDPNAFTINAADEVVLAGSDESIARFERRFGS